LFPLWRSVIATSANPNFDQYATSLAEEFSEVVDDNVFVSNTVFVDAWSEAKKRNPGRFLALPIAQGTNNNATAFGMYDPLPAAAQTTLSAATFPWSFYVVSLPMSYQELATIQGKNMRVDLLGYQLENSIGSLASIIGNDITNFSPKSAATANAYPGLGIVEATDDGTLVNLYGNILRTGAGSFLNWQGKDIRTLTTANIGSASNDPTPALFYRGYTATTQGSQTVTEIYSSKEGLATYMYTMQAQQRFAAGDIANPGFAGAALFGAVLKADDHIVNPTNGGNIGCNFYLINRFHTGFNYFTPKKGAEFIPWTNTSDGALAQVCRYVLSFQYASSQPRTGGQIINVNSLSNL